MSRFQYYQPNYRATGDRKDDCIRAVAKALGLSWKVAYDTLCEAGRECMDNPTSLLSVRSVMKKIGFEQVREHFAAHVTPNLLADKFRDKTILCYCGGYYVTVVNGVVYDLDERSAHLRVASYFINQ